MSDSFTLVHGLPHVYQFEQGKSQYRCEAATLAALSGFAYPNHWPNLSNLMHEIYTKYVPGGDVPGNEQGMTKSQFVDWCENNGKRIGFHDLQPILDSGDMDALRLEMAAMNRCGIPVALGINDESVLYQAVQQADGSWQRGPKMHNWSDKGLRHSFIRVGMDNEHPVTLINDPATACPPFPYPTPVLWEDLVRGGLNTAIGIMPPGVAAPPADFRFHVDGKDNPWPVPPPVVNHEQAASTLHSFDTPLAAIENMANVLGSSHLQSIVQTLRSGRDAVLVDIGK